MSTRRQKPKDTGRGAGPLPQEPRAVRLRRALAPWLLACAAGAAVSLAWPTPDIGPLVFPGVALLLYAVRGLGARRRLLVGWLAGAVAFGTAFYWVYGTMRVMSSLPPAVAALALVLFAAWHGLLFAVFAALAEPVRRWSGGASLLAVPALFALLEWLFPYVFPCYLGYALWRILPLAQLADLTGTPGTTFLVVLVGAALADGAARWRGERWRGLRPLAVAGGLLVAVTVYGVIRIADVQSAPEKGRLRVALVQPNPTVPEKESRVSEVRYRMLQRALDLTEPLVTERGAFDLVVWPEGAFPFYLPDFDGPLEADPLTWQIRAARAVRALPERLGADLVLGGLRRPADDRTRNAVLLLRAGGAPVEIYDKMVLVPFGEYMPLSETFPSLRHRVKGISDFAAGSEYVRFVVHGQSALVTVCYEAILPGFVRRGLAGGGDFVLNVTNDLWFGDTREAALHLMGQVARTIENRVPLVRSTTTGISAFVDATGEVVATAPSFVPALLRGEVVLRDVGSLYRSIGDVFLWVVTAGGAAATTIGWRRRRSAAGEERTA